MREKERSARKGETVKDVGWGLRIEGVVGGVGGVGWMVFVFGG